jgi:hypothetical protein
MTQLGGSLVCEYNRTALLSTRVSCNTEKIWWWVIPCWLFPFYTAGEGNSGATDGEANGQLPISFGDLPIAIFISKLLSIEILLFQNYLFIFELDGNCIFFPPSESHVHTLLVLSVKN